MKFYLRDGDKECKYFVNRVIINNICTETISSLVQHCFRNLPQFNYFNGKIIDTEPLLRKRLFSEMALIEKLNDTC